LVVAEAVLSLHFNYNNVQTFQIFAQHVLDPISGRFAQSELNLPFT
jgi:hypothetical protein